MAKPATITTESRTTTPQTPEEPLGPLLRRAAPPARWADERLGIAKLGNGLIRKIFPDHWSFLLGEIALYSFVILLLTGVFLTIWFKPAMGDVDYNGSYQLLKGLQMSEAYQSALNISFDIRGGLLMRQIHHWAAMLFIASMMTHMLRVFFTGAFRKPRELNWLLGVGLMGLGLVEGFAGYSLPDDLLSGTGLRFVDGLVRSIPLIGTWAEFFVFGGEFPGDLIVPRLYMVHILLIPALILGLIAGHLALVVYHKHTQYPGPGRTEHNVVGYPLFPVYMAKAGGFFFIVFGVLILMGAFMQINPIWMYGPYNPAEVTAGSQPDWYMGFVEGAIRIMPNWEWHLGSTTWSWNVFLPGIGLLTLLFVLLGTYPFVEQWVTKDTAEHHLAERPRHNATRTAFGVAGIACYCMFFAGGGNDLIALKFHVSLNAVTYFLRVAVFVVPVIAFIVTKRICIGLQRSAKERVLHGAESGIIVRDPSGSYSERHTPISAGEAWVDTSEPEYLPLAPAKDASSAEKRHALAARFYFRDNVRKPTRYELEEAAHHVHDGTQPGGDLHDGHNSEDHEISPEGEGALAGGTELRQSPRLQ